MATGILAEILERKQQEVAAAKQSRSLVALRREAESAVTVGGGTGAARSFSGALRRGTRRGVDGQPSPALIAELKKASPSKGLIRADFQPASLAGAYRQGGASVLSVLTDETFFQGQGSFLQVARQASGLPVLRKDFIVEPYQVYETKVLGADALLLIVAALEPSRLKDLLALTASLGMEALVEIHDEVELEQALQAGATVLGVNNRDLRTFRTDLAVTERLAPQVPRDRLVVAESGIGRRDDLLRVGRAGAAAALVGESLMRQPDVTAAARDLLGLAPEAPLPSRPWIKICGHTDRGSLLAAVAAGAAAVGFVFAPSSRQVSPALARELSAGLPEWLERVGVFAVPADPDEVAAMAKEAGVTAVQLHGSDSPELIRECRRRLPREVRLLAGLRVQDEADLARLPDLAAAGANAFLLDAFVPGRSGGTGKAIDWSLVPLARQRLGAATPVYLAGGLSPANLRAAAAASGADGFDVSSGVETDGRKDDSKIWAFLQALEGDAS
ncbi:MAG: indole-3-glycerol phosphate synthase TrpC [Symbiobacteriia bacterium]